MAQVDASTRQAWSSSPRTKVDLIVHVDGNVNERADELQKSGVEVTRNFRLTRSLSVRCTGARALKLLDVPWITRVESDRKIQAQGR